MSSTLLCELCGLKLKSDQGLNTHMGCMHKDHIKNNELLKEIENNSSDITEPLNIP